MGKIFTIFTLLFLMTSFNIYAKKIDALKISGNNRFLIHQNGQKFFPVADTAWKIAWKLNRSDVEKYLQIRVNQKFNTIAIVAFPMDEMVTNVYGDHPFEIENGKYNPLKPVIKNYKNKYDYWNHLNFIINAAKDKGLYVVLLPAWGSRVAGDYGSGHPSSEIIFNEKNAYQYAKWLSQHFKKYNNIIWMLGGDRNAVYGKYDYRNVFNAMAKGLIAGNGKQPLISYHPQKWAPNSSEWFHNAKWLSFNSVQDQPSDQINAIIHDYNLKPVKPTWLFEGGYEKRGDGEKMYNDWHVRFQAYQTVFAGGFGYTYGHMDIWHFSNKVPDLDEKNITAKESTEWEKSMDDPGANDMRHLLKLMTLWDNKQFLERIPDQSLIDGDKGKMTGWEGQISSCIQATRGSKGDYAMIYSADGSNFRVKMNRLAGKKMDAYWFDPRNGKWNVNGKEFDEQKPFKKNILSGKKAAVQKFDPPGKIEPGNDWILILE